MIKLLSNIHIIGGFSSIKFETNAISNEFFKCEVKNDWISMLPWTHKGEVAKFTSIASISCKIDQPRLQLQISLLVTLSRECQLLNLLTNSTLNED
jgi:hypothetical protein